MTLNPAEEALSHDQGERHVAKRLAASAGLSTAATSYLSSVLAAQAYLSTGSAVLAVLVFAIQWLPPLFFAGLSPRLIARHTPGLVLRLSEVGNILSAVLLFTVDWQVAIFAILILRGVFETVIRVARSTVAKQLITDSQLGRVTANMAMAQYIGAVGGGTLGIMFETGMFSVYAIVGISILAILPLLGISGHPIVHRSGSRFRDVLDRALHAVRGNPELARSIALFATTTIIFQGFITVGRTEIAFVYTENAEAWFFWVQQITSVAIIAGSLFVSLFWSARGKSVRMDLVAISGCLILGLMPLTGGIFTVLVCYAVFVFIFELCFLRLSIEINYHCEGHQIADVNAIVYAFVTLGMAGLTVGAAYLVELTSLAVVEIILGLACLGLIIFIGRPSRTHLES
jgi:MFS family permease